MTAAVDVRGLVVRYRGGERPVLDGFDLVLSPGESVAVTGRSGSGKSSLLLHIAGLRRPEAGEITVLGQRLGPLSASALAALRAGSVGFVFQRAHLLAQLSVRQNIEIPLRLAGLRVAEHWARVAPICEALGVTDLLPRGVDRLSVGEAQRVALVRALAVDPALLLADEPTGALDHVSADALGRTLMGWQRGVDARGRQRTLLVATHDLGLAALLDRRVAVGA